MIFKQADAILKKQKRQTRRPNFPYELSRQLHKHGWVYPRAKVSAWARVEWRWGNLPWSDWLIVDPITDTDIAEANRILAENVVALPVQPGRGKKAVGRIRITRIRREGLGDINGEDCIAEGANNDAYSFIDETVQTLPGIGTGPVRHYRSLPAAFSVLWDSVYGLGAWDRMKDDDVWVLEFELVEGL